MDSQRPEIVILTLILAQDAPIVIEHLGSATCP